MKRSFAFHYCTYMFILAAMSYGSAIITKEKLE